MTRFRGNAVPMDRPGHYVYLRDAEDGDYWSISWQPVGKPLNQAKYTCRLSDFFAERRTPMITMKVLPTSDAE